MKREQADSWQLDPTHLRQRGCVQVWGSNGVMLTARQLVDGAKEAVKKGEAYVISDQAIGLFEDGPYWK